MEVIRQGIDLVNANEIEDIRCGGCRPVGLSLFFGNDGLADDGVFSDTEWLHLHIFKRIRRFKRAQNIILKTISSRSSYGFEF